MSSKYLWLCVETDKYELPLAVAESSTELARKCGTNKHNVEAQVYGHWSGKMTGRKFVVVPRKEIEE